MSVFSHIEPFDSMLKASADFDVFYRAALKYPIGIINDTGMRRRIHNTSVSSNTVNVLRGKIECRKKLIHLETDTKIRSKLRYSIAVSHLHLSYYLTGKNNLMASLENLKGLFSTASHSPYSIKLFIKNVARGVCQIVRIR